MGKKQKAGQETVKKLTQAEVKEIVEKEKAQKKAEKLAKKKAKKGFFSRVASYFRDLKNELKRVVWPTRSRVIKNTTIVLVTVAVVTVLVTTLDFGFSSLLKLLLGQGS